MWIQTEATGTKRLHVGEITADEYPEGVEFSENGVAQVTADVGEALIEECDPIHEYTAEETDG